MEGLTEAAGPSLWALGQVVLVIAVAIGLSILAKRRYSERITMQTRLQIIQASIIVLALVIVVIIAPIGDNRRGQLLSFLGIVISAAIALSSTTVLGNAMAGLMLRSIRAYKPGDYIHCGDHTGRVTEMDLLHTEIQTEESDLTTLSNIYLITHPFQVIRSQEGTILSVPISLGYDVPRERVEELLLAAIGEAGLETPYVHVIELGDFSVTYRAAGRLKPAKNLLANRARLRASALDALHRGGVEIVSPSFMNTRAMAPDARIIPEQARSKPAEPKVATADEVTFDKAEEAESLASMTDRHKAMLTRIAESEQALKAAQDDSEKAALTTEIEKTKKSAELLAGLIAKREEKLHSKE